MPTDIAVLGIKVDSSDTLKATSALQGLAAASVPAAAAAAGLGKAAAVAAASHAGLSTQSMAAMHATRSLVESLAMGVPVTTMMAQQIGHLSYAASGSSGLAGAFKEAATSVFGLISPTTLVVGGLAAVAAGSYMAISAMAATGKQFDDTARSAGTTISQLRDLAMAASFKGIQTPDFLKAMDRFASNVYEAQHNMGGLADVFRANNTSAKDFNDYLAKAADLIRNASSDQQRLQILQQMGLPATMDWVRFLSQGSAGIREAAAEAAKFGATADEAMIAKARQFDEAWSKAIQSWSTGFKSGFLSFIGYLGTIDSSVNSLLIKLGSNVGANLLRDAMNGGPTSGSRLSQSAANQFYDAVGSGAPFNKGAGGTKDRDDLKNRIALEQPLLGLLGQTSTANQASKPEKGNDRDNRSLPKAA